MKLANIELPNKINLNKIDLFLNGAAIRSKFFVQTYVVSLYSAEKITDEKIAIESNIERSLRMQIITPLATSRAVSENIQSGMKDSLGSLYYEQKDLIEDLRNVIESSVCNTKTSLIFIKQRRTN